MSIDNERTTRLGAVTPTDEQPRGRKRKTATVFGLITAAALGAGGVALAAILLTTNITGAATINDVDTANDVEVSASAASGSQLDCSNIKISPDNATLEFNPVLNKPKGGGNASGVPIAGGDCTITLQVSNVGDTSIRLDGSSKVTGPKGWIIGTPTGPALGTIASGKTATATIPIKANQDAEAGAFGGKLVYTDAA